MQSPIRLTVRAVQQFLSDGSNLMSLLMVVSLFVAIVALLPLGGLFKAPASDAANATTPSILVMRQEALKDQWLEARYTTISPMPFSRERQDDLKEQWLARGGANAPVVSTAKAIKRQEELKDQWLERRSR